MGFIVLAVNAVITQLHRFIKPAGQLECEFDIASRAK